jgi:hypothetical protein
MGSVSEQAMHRDVGTLVLVANIQFQHATFRACLAAWLFGRHEVLVHLNRRCRISFWRGRPYLLSFKEGKP